MMEKDHVQPESFKDSIIFISMYNDIGWGRKGNEERWESNSSSGAKDARKFPWWHWSFFGHGPSEEKWFFTLVHRPDGLWNRVAQQMIFLAKSGNLVFRGTSSLSRGPRRSKGGETHGCVTTRSLRLLRYYNASLSPSISAAFTEPLRIGARILLSEANLTLHFARRHLLRKRVMTEPR